MCSDSHWSVIIRFICYPNAASSQLLFASFYKGLHIKSFESRHMFLIFFKEEKDEWHQFQADLQTAVVVANDIKVEAQQELRTLRRQLQEEQDHTAKLSLDLEALQGVRYNSHLSQSSLG